MPHTTKKWHTINNYKKLLLESNEHALHNVIEGLHCLFQINSLVEKKPISTDVNLLPVSQFLFLDQEPFNLDAITTENDHYNCIQREIDFQLNSLIQDYIALLWFSKKNDTLKEEDKWKHLHRETKLSYFKHSDTIKDSRKHSSIEMEDDSATSQKNDKYMENPDFFKEQLPSIAQNILQYLLAKNDYTYEHSVRVGLFAENLVIFVMEYLDKLESSQKPRGIDAVIFDSFDSDYLKLTGTLHDIGKIYCRDDILLKSGELAHVDKYEINRHSAVGIGLIVSNIIMKPSKLLFPVLCHHLPKKHTREIISNYFSVLTHKYDVASSDYNVVSLQAIIMTSVLKICDSVDATISRSKPEEKGQKISNLILQTKQTDMQNKQVKNANTVPSFYWETHWELPLFHEEENSPQIYSDDNKEIFHQVESIVRNAICEWLQEILDGIRCGEITDYFKTTKP